MKQTAVEWYNQQIVDRQNGNGDSRSRDEIFEQAKEMEKEQHQEQKTIDEDFDGGLTMGQIIPKEENKKYPIGGYAQGNYTCNCLTCKQQFMGDKRAVQCESCAIKTIEESKQETICIQTGLPCGMTCFSEEVCNRNVYTEEDVKNAFLDGWQLRDGDLPFPKAKKKWFNEFKNK